MKIEFWWQWEDLNLRPNAYEALALTPELHCLKYKLIKRV